MWLHIPSASSHSAPATEGSTWPCDSSLAMLLERSCTWKGKSLPRKSWLRVLRTASSTTPLFGAILKPSTAASCVEQWISSWRDIPASLSAPPGASSPKRIRDTSGPTFFESSTSLRSAPCSSRTSTLTSGSDSSESGLTYAHEVSAWRSEALARQKLGRRIFGSDSSRWPSARAEDAESCGNHPGAQDSLTGIVRHWKTPHGLSGTDRHGKTAGGGGEFARQALAWQTDWPSPRTITGGGESRERKQELGRQRSGGGDLQAASLAFSLPARISSSSGRTSSAATPASPRLLNPLFVEWLMGLPPGWTGSEPVATESYRLWLLTHTSRLHAVWQVLSAPGEPTPATAASGRSLPVLRRADRRRSAPVLYAEV